MPDIVAVILAQHREVESLLEEAEQEGTDTAALLRQVSALLLPHSEAEESFVYPRIAELSAEEEDEVYDGTAEHHHVEQLLRELLMEEPEAPGYDGKLAAVIGELRHHVEEEEEDLLPVLTAKASAAEREEMGARFLEATGMDEEDLDLSAVSVAASGSAGGSGDEPTREELYEQAQKQDVPGRSGMTKDELAEAVED